VAGTSLHISTDTPLSEYLAYWGRRPSVVVHVLLLFAVVAVVVRQWLWPDADLLLLLIVGGGGFFALSFPVFLHTLMRHRHEEVGWYETRDLPAPPPVWRSQEHDRYFETERDVISDRFFGNTIINTATAYAMTTLLIVTLVTTGQPYNGELWFVTGSTTFAYVFAYGVVIGPREAVREVQSQRLARIERGLADGSIVMVS